MARTSSSKQRQLAEQTAKQRRHKAGLLVAVLGAAAATFGLASMYFKTPRHTSSFTGEQWISELLKGHDGRFSDQFGMSKHLFKHLLKELEEKANFGSTKHVSAKEQLAIFLYASTTGISNRKLQERFQRSGETISK